MAEPTITTLEEETQLLLQRLDAIDLIALGAMLTDDAQSVDEITRGWTRGRAAIEAYMAKLEATVSDVHSRASDLRATSWEDTGLVTFVLRQTYTLNPCRSPDLVPFSLAGACRLGVGSLVRPSRRSERPMILITTHRITPFLNPEET